MVVTTTFQEHMDWRLSNNESRLKFLRGGNLILVEYEECQGDPVMQLMYWPDQGWFMGVKL